MKPNSPAWISRLSARNFGQAQSTQVAVNREQSENICSICGDSKYLEYIDLDSKWNIYLCDGCRDAQVNIFKAKFSLVKDN